jgi:hypothetical protein
MKKYREKDAATLIRRPAGPSTDGLTDATPYHRGYDCHGRDADPDRIGAVRATCSDLQPEHRRFRPGSFD